MGKGGGGGGGTNWMDVERDRLKFDQDMTVRRLEDEKAAKAEAARLSAYESSMNAGVEGLRNRGRQMLTERGLDTDRYGQIVEDAIASTHRGIGRNDANPGAYYTDSVIDKALGSARDNARLKYQSQVGTDFGQGFEQKYFGSSADDAYINQILAQQRGTALDQVNRARDRGQLDDRGYYGAMQRINEMETTARANANKLGDAVLQGNRTRLVDVGNEAKAAAGAYELGKDFDHTVYQSKFTDTLGSLTNSLEGDVRGALEGQKFFDIGDLLSTAGTKQGAVNAAAESPDAIAAREKLRYANRGVGSTGGTF